jgi:hypothetical protein
MGAAAFTRGRPGARGKASTTRCARRTRPPAIAVTTWIARRSASNGASSRRRHGASTSGSPTCAWAPSTGTVSIPQASITARSVRTRRQSCASAQAHACCNPAHANQPRVETGGRPRVVAWGKRRAQKGSPAAPHAAHGHVSAQWRRGGRDEGRDLPARSPSRQTMLPVSPDRPPRLSSPIGPGRPRIRRDGRRHNPLLEGIH